MARNKHNGPARGKKSRGRLAGGAKKVTPKGQPPKVAQGKPAPVSPAPAPQSAAPPVGAKAPGVPQDATARPDVPPIDPAATDAKATKPDAPAKNLGGRPRKRLDKLQKEQVVAVVESGLDVTLACKALQISWTVLRKTRAEDPEFREALQYAEDLKIAQCELTMYERGVKQMELAAATAYISQRYKVRAMHEARREKRRLRELEAAGHKGIAALVAEAQQKIVNVLLPLIPPDKLKEGMRLIQQAFGMPSIAGALPAPDAGDGDVEPAGA